MGTNEVKDVMKIKNAFTPIIPTETLDGKKTMIYIKYTSVILKPNASVNLSSGSGQKEKSKYITLAIIWVILIEMHVFMGQDSTGPSAQKVQNQHELGSNGDNNDDGDVFFN
uniref:Uncharacterized protein n=1 Tax=Glossina austeni TaxID=7395 RepID=A0A1A9UQL2_GLOAU